MVAPISSRYRRLRAANLVVGLVLAAEAGAMLVLTNGLSLPVTASYLRSDPIAAQVGAPSQTLFELGIGATVAAFLLLAALDHLVVASPGVHRWYERNLERGVNYAAVGGVLVECLDHDRAHRHVHGHP